MQIELVGVGKAYGTQSALADITIRAATGDVILLLGPNGAGKSTLLRLLAGIEDPTTGRLLVDGERITLEYRGRVGHLPQRPKFYEHLTVHAWLHYFAQLKALPPRLTEPRISQLLTEYDLLTAANTRIAALSGGYRQRLAIVTALLNDPELLLLDEPLTSLDPDVRITLMDRLTPQLSGRITVIATHVFSGFEHLAQRLWYLDAGQLMADTAVSETFAALQDRIWETAQLNTHNHTSDLVVLSRRVTENATAYRVLGETPPPGGVPVEPTLEDVYGALAQRWIR